LKLVEAGIVAALCPVVLRERPPTIAVATTAMARNAIAYVNMKEAVKRRKPFFATSCFFQKLSEITAIVPPEPGDFR
jgi:hypothetical protein